MKLQAPISKPRGKLQIPSSKSQRISKSQAPRAERTTGPMRYVDLECGSSRVNEASNGNNSRQRPFELEERTAQFGEAIVRFAKRIPRDPGNDRLIGQLIGCGTSIGANYCEADERVSKKDFRNTIGRCVKEAKETKYFLRMIAAAEPKLAAEARELFREAKELHLIFASIYRK
jgi:four helix bundle protein